MATSHAGLVGTGDEVRAGGAGAFFVRMATIHWGATTMGAGGGGAAALGRGKVPVALVVRKAGTCCLVTG